MILFIILLTLIAAATVIALTYAIAAGLSFIAVFGDLIVFSLIVWLIVKIFRKKK